jgi:uncharacterized peroxidase-related enzyme
MPFIETIDYQNAQGELKKIYDDLIKKRGKLAEVHTIQSLNPASIVAHMDLYMTIMFGKSPLKRYQREMMAVVVSVANKCLYCTEHHAQALLHYWKDPHKVDQLKKHYSTLDLPEIDEKLCRYAERVTLTPSYEKRENNIRELREAGLNDRSILDATLVISYFNFVNRIVLSLGVDLEEDRGGYKY